MGFGLRDMVGSGFLVCGSPKRDAISTAKPNRANIVNILCHPHAAITYPPMVGASIGERPRTNNKSEKILGLSSTGNRSRTIVIEATAAEQLPTACTKRRAIKVSISCVTAQPMDAIR